MQMDLSGDSVKQRQCQKRKFLSENLRIQILERDNYCCRMCLSKDNIEIHELTPQALGGKLSLDNCFVLCYNCHLHIHNSRFFKDLNKKSTKEGSRLARKKGKILGRPMGSKDKYPRRRDGYIARWSGR